MNRIYLAGPMSGIPDLNFPLFNSEAARLRALGYTVINPAEINGGVAELAAVSMMTPEQHAAHWATCMRRDIPELVSCEAIALLPGWEASRGACLQHLIAQELGMSVVMADRLIFSAEGVDLIPSPGRPIAISLNHFVNTATELAQAIDNGISNVTHAARGVHKLALHKLLRAMGGAQ